MKFFIQDSHGQTLNMGQFVIGGDWLKYLGTLKKTEHGPDKELLERSFALGLHLFCGQKGASLYLAKYCQEVNKVH